MNKLASATIAISTVLGALFLVIVSCATFTWLLGIEFTPSDVLGSVTLCIIYILVYNECRGVKSE